MKRPVKLCVAAMMVLAGAALAQPPGGDPSGGANGPPMNMGGPPPGGGAPAGGPPAGMRRPPEPPARGPSMEAALTIAKSAVTTCKGFDIGVTILDSAGTPKLYYVPDGANGVHAYRAYRKAHAALDFKMPSGKVMDASKSDPAIAAKVQANAGSYMTFAGGLPITVGNDVIGAVGVSGAEPSSTDEHCADEGLKAAAKQLK